MTPEYFPVVIERESNNTFSAWVAGLPGVYAAADTAAIAKRAIRSALAAHLKTLNELDRRLPKTKAELVVLRYAAGKGHTPELRYTGLGALLGRKTSLAKAQASRRNGRKGGRPRSLKAVRRVKEPTANSAPPVVLNLMNALKRSLDAMRDTIKETTIAAPAKRYAKGTK